MSPLLKKNNFLYVVIGLVAGGLLLSCQDFEEDLDTKRTHLVQLIEQDPNFSLLARALKETGWAETLSGPDNYTLLAPHDGIFEEMGVRSWEDLSEEEWEELILYHTLAGSYAVEDLPDGVLPSMLEHYYLQFSEEEEETLINREGRFLAPDIQVSNGWIHGIDRVLTPSTISVFEIAKEQEKFTVFVRVLETVGLEDTLATTGPFTLLAPTDAAFEAYFKENGLTEDSWLASAGLETWVQYHLVAEEIHSEDITRGNYTTFSGLNVFTSIDLEESLWINGLAQLSLEDIPARNGRIQGLDQVLDAPRLTFQEQLAEFSESDTPEFTQLSGALTHVGLDLVLNEAGQEYTLMAPTDAAFEAWYELMNVSGYEEVDEQVLEDILRYHIIPEVVFTQDFRNEETLETLLEGKTITVDEGNYKLNGVNLTEDHRNVLGVNGLFQGVHAVLIPPAE